MKEEGSVYRRLFRDICEGYTSCTLFEQNVYIKHLAHNDQVDLEDIYNQYYQNALQRGVPTEEETLNFLIQEKEWSEEDEKFIEDQEIFVESLIQSKRNLILKSQKEAKNKIIEEALEKLNKKKELRKNLLGNTCESYAENKTNDFFIIKSFYKDKKLKKILFSEDDYESLSHKEVGRIVEQYNKSYSIFNEQDINLLILSDFFKVYFPFCEDTLQFFGKAVCNLTLNQIRLITFARIFKNIFEQNPNIPESIKNDPEALLDYASTSEKEKEKLEERLSQDGASTIVGATKEDYEFMGIDTNENAGNVSLHEEAKKKGGSLTMEDLMRLSGN